MLTVPAAIAACPVRILCTSASPDGKVNAATLVAAQRTLKAVGTFAGQAMLRDNRSYLGFIPRAMANARRALARLPELSGLLQLLEGPLQFTGDEGGP